MTICIVVLSIDSVPLSMHAFTATSRVVYVSYDRKTRQKTALRIWMLYILWLIWETQWIASLRENAITRLWSSSYWSSIFSVELKNRMKKLPLVWFPVMDKPILHSKYTTRSVIEGSKDHQNTTDLCCVLTVLTSFNCLTHHGDDKPKDY
jgi:hypothetical protein